MGTFGDAVAALAESLRGNTAAREELATVLRDAATGGGTLPPARDIAELRHRAWLAGVPRDDLPTRMPGREVR